MSRPDKALSMLGIAMKAGKVKSGETATEAAIKSFEAQLVIIAADASENTRKHFRDMCEYRDIPYREYSDKENLGRVIGRDLRSNLAITDHGLAKALTGYIDSDN
ncbi:MAG: ribosomal L7Ae/L30e/S12e/Gadd45 family protein [Lachnospiraceae bacterium]|nr:ribosomal L7Ae/L30e/S12e/Gadd45 family protein [Lachnospiraceae bacterium]